MTMVVIVVVVVAVDVLLHLQNKFGRCKRRRHSLPTIKHAPSDLMTNANDHGGDSGQLHSRTANCTSFLFDLFCSISLRTPTAAASSIQRFLELKLTMINSSPGRTARGPQRNFCTS